MIQNITLPSKQVLLFGGVYSNFQALQQMREIAEKKGFAPSEIICNGDIVGYCAQPEECVQHVKNWGIHNIIGNVEENLREGVDDCGCDFDEGTQCDLLSKQWYPFAQKAISVEAVEWMKTLPNRLTFELGNKKWAVVHGSPSHISEFIFKSTKWELKESHLNALQVDGIVAGHSGLPFSEEHQDKHWINPGVIGMPANDGQTKVWYAILKENNGLVEVEHHTFSYQHEKASSLMKEKGLPESYAKTLVTGIWDNCDILPEEETKAQGKRIKF
jgi:predicted phosphodiesterase